MHKENTVFLFYCERAQKARSSFISVLLLCFARLLVLISLVSLSLNFLCLFAFPSLPRKSSSFSPSFLARLHSICGAGPLRAWTGCWCTLSSLRFLLSVCERGGGGGSGCERWREKEFEEGERSLMLSLLFFFFLFSLSLFQNKKQIIDLRSQT